MSIVIPTYGDRAYDLLKPCLDSIRKFTDLAMCEVIVVANGCTLSTREVCESESLLWFDEAIGYARACNEGINVAQGEYVVLLNNDTILLEQPRNQWIEILLRAFWDEKVAISGPMMAWCPHAEYNFLIGFCIMIRMTFLNQFGMYDEVFEAYGEDTDLCVRAQKNGWGIKQVPDDEIRRLDGQDNIGTGYFPIYHKGNESYRNWPEGDKLLAKNRNILHDRYAAGIQKAVDTDGFMLPEELRWLAERSRMAHTVIELGSWHGKSARAIADNLPPNGTVYCVDTWNGSENELLTNHVSAKEMDGDHAFNEFCRNLWDHIESGKVIPIRMHGKHAAQLLKDKGVKADLVFIDGGHQYHEVREDIANFLPLRKEQGIICGHDYMQGLMPDVTTAVLDTFGGNVGHAANTTIWYTDSGASVRVVAEEIRQPEAPKIYDCFTFFNELELLELRFNELWDVVDRFVIVEATKTHQGNPKPLYFGENLKRFEKFLSKVTHIVDEFPDNMETGGGPSFPSGINWSRERHQREAVMRGLTDCKDSDIIIIGDGDEIARAETIKSYKPEMGLMRMEMQLYCYYLNCSGGEWRESKILPYGLLKQMGPCNTRYSLHTIGTHGEPLWNAGWHFSFMGGADRVKEKIRCYSHGEYNTPEVLDHVDDRLAKGQDVFGRDGFTYQMVELNKHFPRHVIDNLEHYQELGFIK